MLEPDPELREAEFSRYLQGLPYWQIPLRRPLWFVHKARRGLVPGDESIEDLGGRVLDVVRRIAREHPGETAAVVSHADPIQAAWILLDGRAHNEREMYRKAVDKAGMLTVDLEGDTPVSWEYTPPPDRGQTGDRGRLPREPFPGRLPLGDVQRRSPGRRRQPQLRLVGVRAAARTDRRTATRRRSPATTTTATARTSRCCAS